MRGVSKRSSRYLPLAALALLALIWGYTWVPVKIGVAYTSPFMFAALRTFPGGLLLLVLVAALGRPLRPKALRLTVLLGVLQTSGFMGLTTAALVSELIEARDEKKLLRFQKQIASYELLIVDELGFVPLSKTGAELLFEMLSQRYERGSTMVTSNLPFQEWTEVLGSERLTGALLDRLTHHVHILEMNADSYRLKQSRRKQTPSSER